VAAIAQADMLEDRIGREKVAALTELLTYANEALSKPEPDEGDL
jgi:beta-lactamase class D